MPALYGVGNRKSRTAFLNAMSSRTGSGSGVWSRNSPASAGLLERIIGGEHHPIVAERGDACSRAARPTHMPDVVTTIFCLM